MTIERDAVALALSATRAQQQELLQSVVDVARAVFDAQVSSVFLLDGTGRFLVFRAVSGAGSDALVGQRFPVDQGVAGWVLGSREPLAIDDLSTSPWFAQSLAKSTGYVPRTLLASPLLYGDHPVGVLEVLDHRADRARILGELSVLGLLARQASMAIGLMHRVNAALAGRDGEQAVLVDITEAVDALGASRRAAATRLLTAVRDVLVAASG
jgi:GAF domain-containing protein